MEDACLPCPCHLIGMIVFVLGFGLVIIGLIVMIVKPEDIKFVELDNKGTAGMLLVLIGGAFVIFFLIYVCYIVKKQWKFFGCCRISKVKNHKEHPRRSTGRTSNTYVNEGIEEAP